MLLLASSTASLCILVSGRPYINRISMFTAVAQELLFSYMCIFCLIFTAEFSHRFVRVAADLGNAICVMMASVGALGFCLLTYSIIWQIVYNRRMRDEIVKRHELLKGLRYMQRQESVREQLKLATVNEDDESGDDDDDIAEIGLLARIVRKSGVIHHLKKGIEYVLVRLLYLVQEEHGIG